MYVNIIIPTCGRLESLKQTIKSIKESDYKKVFIFIVADGFIDEIKEFSDTQTTIIHNPERRDWVFSMNKALKLIDGDYFIYAADDIYFQVDCISKAVEAMERIFPSGDALVSLKQRHKRSGGAFGLMGRKFVNRFPDKAAFCPDYIHFGADKELRLFAERVKLYHLCFAAIVDHNRALRDRTYELGMEVKERDMRIKTIKRKRDLFWGESFERINE